MIPGDTLIEGLNFLTYHNPYAKISFLDVLFSSFEYKKEESRKRNISYIDIDTLFTSIIKSGGIKAVEDFDVNLISKHNMKYTRIMNQRNSLDIYLPSYNDIYWIFEEILKNIESTSLVVFDSFSSFYTLFECKDFENFKRAIGKLNHYRYFLIMILLRYCSWSKIPLLVTNLVDNNKENQVKSQTNKRLSLYCKTQIFAYFNHVQELIIDFLIHPNMQDRIVKIESKQIRNNIFINSKE